MPVYRGLKNHLIARVAQLRAPEKTGGNRLGHRAQSGYDLPNLIFIQAGNDALGRVPANRLVLKGKRYG